MGGREDTPSIRTANRIPAQVREKYIPPITEPGPFPIYKPDRLGEPDCKVGVDTVHENKALEKGLVALVDIDEGDEVFIFNGRKGRAMHGSGFAQSRPNAIVVGWDKKNEVMIWADPNTAKGSPLKYLNHSCNPNTARSENKDAFTFIATRNIKKGESITADYALLETDLAWTMKCACHSPNCREKITSILDLGSEKIIANWKNIPQFLQEWILKNKIEEAEQKVQEICNEVRHMITRNIDDPPLDAAA